MERRIVFFDVDDTLVHHRGDRSYVPESAKAAIRQLQQEGHTVAIATGRGYNQIKQIMKLLNIEHAVCFNGHMAVAKGRVIMEEVLHEEDMKRLLSQLGRGIMPFIVSDQDYAYIKDLFGKVRSTIKKEVMAVEGAEGDLQLGSLKKYRGHVGHYFSMMFFNRKFPHEDKYPNLDFKAWGGRGFEVANKGVSKLSGIHWLAGHLGFDEKLVVVFGDNYNDLEMLQGAEMSVAMGNAVEAAKEAAKHVTDHVGEDGIAKACHYLGLIKEEVH